MATNQFFCTIGKKKLNTCHKLSFSYLYIFAGCSIDPTKLNEWYIYYEDYEIIIWVFV